MGLSDFSISHKWISCVFELDYICVFIKEYELWRFKLRLYSVLSVLIDEVFRGHEPGQAAGRSVSAADVVLYGVNLILPLMSQDLLKVIKII